MTRKFCNLDIVLTHGIAVPRGFLLDGSHYREAVAPHHNRILAALPEATAVEEVFQSLEMPRRCRAVIEEGIRELPHSDRFAVRSSGAVASKVVRVHEDSDLTSLAGQFDSYLNVPAEMIEEAVRRCWASLFNHRSIASFSIDASYLECSSMAVVVQEMIPAAASAVMMTVDPLGNGDTGAMELAIGPCEALVSGIVSPDEVHFRRSDGALIDVSVGDKLLRVEYGEFGARGENSRSIPVPDDVRRHLSVDLTTVGELIRLAQKVEAIFGSPQDIELVVTDDGTVVITQIRPVTRSPAHIADFPLPQPNQDNNTKETNHD